VYFVGKKKFTQSLNSTFQYARSTKCFQRSCWGAANVIWTNGRHFGRLGLRIKLMCASRGSRLPLRVLHGIHEQTTFSQVVVPPRSRGTMWSRLRSLRSKSSPQYWQVFLSRSKTLCRVNFTSFFGSRSNTSSTITRGIRILNEMVVTNSWSGAFVDRSRQLSKSWVEKLVASSDETIWAWPAYTSEKARRAEQMFTACQSRLSTNTWLFSNVCKSGTVTALSSAFYGLPRKFGRRYH